MITEIGKHKVCLASVEAPIVDKLFADGRKAAIFYSDPPWGDGNLKYWVTMRKKMTGVESAPLSYDALLARIMGLIHHHVSGHVFIETGCRWGDKVANVFMSAGLHNVRQHPSVYRSGSRILPEVIVSAGTAPNLREAVVAPDIMGVDLVKSVISQVATPGGIAFDPCCGMGYTARGAVYAGMEFRGNEFNAVRLAKTIKFLEQHG